MYVVAGMCMCVELTSLYYMTVQYRVWGKMVGLPNGRGVKSGNYASSKGYSIPIVDETRCAQFFHSV